MDEPSNHYGKALFYFTQPFFLYSFVSAVFDRLISLRFDHGPMLSEYARRLERFDRDNLLASIKPSLVRVARIDRTTCYLRESSYGVGRQIREFPDR